MRNSLTADGEQSSSPVATGLHFCYWSSAGDAQQGMQSACLNAPYELHGQNQNFPNHFPFQQGPYYDCKGKSPSYCTGNACFSMHHSFSYVHCSLSVEAVGHLCLANRENELTGQNCFNESKMSLQSDNEAVFISPSPSQKLWSNVREGHQGGLRRYSACGTCSFT